MAGQRVAVQPPIVLLDEYALAPSAEVSSRQSEGFDEQSQRLVYHGPGWVAGGWYQVECHQSSAGYLVRIENLATFVVAEDGSAFERSEVQPGVNPTRIGHAALGPPLMLALALQGVFCLHASAVAGLDRATAFVGSSGCGKSTLAHQLSHRQPPYWTRTADDALATQLTDGAAVALPHLPQLKLAASEQPLSTQPDRLPLVAVCVLERPDDLESRGASGVEIEELDSQEAVLALMRHTMAARLFGPDLRAAHLDFCARASETVPVHRLRYPWREDAMPEVANLLAKL